MKALVGALDPALRRALRSSESAAPLVISVLPQRFEDGAWTGVPRFDWEMRRVLPELISLALTPATRLALVWLAQQRPDTIVIAGNETSLAVPAALRTIVVHHGCAQTHFDRDPEWRGRSPSKLCAAQRTMFDRPNRSFVSPSCWVGKEFAAHYGVPLASVIPQWVPPPPARDTEPSPAAASGKTDNRKVVLGDFRTWNKGRDLVRELAARLPQFEFRALSCTYDTRLAAYAQADAYLSLSVSEGGSYALCDAEVCGLPIVMTDVGNCEEFQRAIVMPWQTRGHVDRVATALDRAFSRPRGESFYASFSLEDCQRAWRAELSRVASRPIQ